ncbi:MAG: NADH-quinone oxidoreductase subunit L [Abditibacteriales bacterium]|nr:NADH-quinone oxidoreductase subunit L [Abditibacteriales bacterium]MDW8367590.1 NADH-quinone oxidoreductase subunit L [Abditibacteriales bacterium]
MDFFLQTAWLVPVFPFVAFVINVFFGAELQKRNRLIPALISIFTMGASFVWSVACFMSGKEFARSTTWFYLGSYEVKMGYVIDPLSVTMMLIVTFIGGLIFIYSVGYMWNDPRFSRFFSYLSLFACAMLWLVMADNYALLYLGWEGVGLCSYLLIGFWFEKPSAMRAAKKAFLITRTGDCGLAIGVFLLFALVGSFSYEDIFRAATETHRGLFVVAAFFLFCGAIGKSAQFPLHTWLPDAMEGPTPVSALIHAATMVAAGVYLVARSFPLFSLADSRGHPIALLQFGGWEITPLMVVTYVGGFTAFMAGTIGIAQNDIKRVLAYSTISQLGFMFMGLGVGGPAVGMFHLMTHAFFKALLFLGSGSVIHAMEHGMHAAHGHGHDEAHAHADHPDPQDMMNMGGLRKKMPTTQFTYFVGALALAGAPFIASGFWSKDEILHYALEKDKFVFIAFGILTAAITAFYTSRQMYLVFEGTPRTDAAAHAHESPKVMTVPLVILAVFAFAAGFIGLPFFNGKWNYFHHYVSETALLNLGAHGAAHGAAHGDAHAAAGAFMTTPMVVAMVCSILAAAVGWTTARGCYRVRPLLNPQEDPILKLGALERFLRNKWWFDELYQATVIRLLFLFNEVFAAFDQKLIDGAVNAVGIITVVVSKIWQFFDMFIVDGLVNLVGWVTKTWGEAVRRVQTGLAQNYMLIIISSAAVLLVVRLLWKG